MFFEGLIQMQLPFILISSGISSGLYLLFLFFNIGQPTEQTVQNNDRESYAIELSVKNTDPDQENTLYNYFNYSFVSAEQLNLFETLQIEKTRPIKFRSFKFAYLFQFAESSYCRPPPQSPDISV